MLRRHDVGWMRRKGAAVGRLWGRRRVACVHVERGQIGVFREEVLNVDERHGGIFYELEHHFFNISWFRLSTARSQN